MSQPKKTRVPGARGKDRKKAASPENGVPEGHDWLNDQRVAQAMGENLEWFTANENALMRDHPDWVGMYLVVSSRTASKVLAVSEDRHQAVLDGMRAQEALDLAARQGMPVGCLITAVWLGIEWD
jgi:hypothetical protein